MFEVCDLGKAKVIVGHTWLKRHNPEIDWEKAEVKLSRCPEECGMRRTCYLKKTARTNWGGRIVEVEG